MNLEALCQRDIVTISAAATVREAAVLMGEQHVGALAVLSADEPPQVLGVVTDRDLALEVVGAEDAATRRHVVDVARTPPVAIPASAGILEAVEAMESAGVRRLLVVDDDGAVAGLVSSDDLLAALADELGGLSRALRKGIERERGVRPDGPLAGSRLLFPSFGTVVAP